MSYLTFLSAPFRERAAGWTMGEQAVWHLHHSSAAMEKLAAIIASDKSVRRWKSSEIWTKAGFDVQTMQQLEKHTNPRNSLTGPTN